eukprot:2416496-Amphidinium_carterae.1
MKQKHRTDPESTWASLAASQPHPPSSVTSLQVEFIHVHVIGLRGCHEEGDVETAVNYLRSSGRADEVAFWGRSMGAPPVAAHIVARTWRPRACSTVTSLGEALRSLGF